LLAKKLTTPYTPEKKELKISESNWEKEKLANSKAISPSEDPFLDW
jgi:hypothetical protein